MKIIDDKGRLFGKINVIDLTIIIFLFTFLPMVLFIYKIIQKRDSASLPLKEYVEIDINCKFTKVKPEIVKLISVGDTEADKDGIINGELTWRGDPVACQYILDLGSGEIQRRTHPILKDIPAMLKLKAEIRDNSLFYNDKRIAINSPIQFKTGKYSAIVIPLEKEKEKEKEEEKEEVDLDLFVTFKNLNEEQANLISPGDKELDSNGKIKAQILDVGKIEDNTREIDLGGNNFIVGVDINKKQVDVKLRIKAELSDRNKLYFNNQLVSNDAPFKFVTDNYTAEGLLSKVMSKEQEIHVKIKFDGVIPELAKLMSEGDIVKERDDRIRGRLKAILSNKPSETQILTLQDNKYITIANPSTRDIIAFLDLICDEKDGTLYFRDYPIKVGNMLVFTTNTYSISGTIIGLEK